MAAIRTFIAIISPQKYKAMLLTFSTGMQFVGFGLTPSLVFFFASVNTKLGVFIFDKDTIPGYVLFFEHLAAAVLVMFVSSIKSKVQKKR